MGETLNSVLAQNYPSLEYLVMDGGSTDESVAVIRAREKELTYWRSEPDHGQAEAINQGFQRATGVILGWLNSDDLYRDDTLRVVADALAGCENEAVVFYGGCELFQDGGTASELRSAVPFDEARLQMTDFIDQPSVFFTRSAWDRVGPLDESLHYAFDWDWFLRAAQCCRFQRCDRVLSRYRIHRQHKTGSGGLRSLGRNERSGAEAFSRRCGSPLSIFVGLSGCSLVVKQAHAVGAALSPSVANISRGCPGNSLRAAVLAPAARYLSSDAMGNLRYSVEKKDLLLFLIRLSW